MIHEYGDSLLFERSIHKCESFDDITESREMLGTAYKMSDTSKSWVGWEVKQSWFPLRYFPQRLRTLWGLTLLRKISEELCGETVEKVTISSSSRDLIIMRFIVTFINII